MRPHEAYVTYKMLSKNKTIDEFPYSLTYLSVLILLKKNIDRAKQIKP